VQVFLEQLVVDFADLFDQLLAVLLGFFQHVGWNVADDVVGAHGFVFVGDRLHPDEIDHADELVFCADRQLNRHWVALQLGFDLRQGFFEVRADAVHLVDEADARDAIFIGLTPHGFRLRLDTRNGIEHGARAIEDAQRALDFDGEVDVPGCIDDVDAVIAPEARRRGRSDRDAAFLFLLHPVHDGGAFVDFTDFVRNPGVEEDPLGGGRLPGIDVGHDADVPDFF
jgi:hypothetical protein